MHLGPDRGVLGGGADGPVDDHLQPHVGLVDLGVGNAVEQAPAQRLTEADELADGDVERAGAEGEGAHDLLHLRIRPPPEGLGVLEGVGQGGHEGSCDRRVALGREHRVPAAQLPPVVHDPFDIGAQQPGDCQRAPL